MSDNEFEKYLAILGGLLRLSPKHREEIAAELRDHLEERLERLLAEGYSRHKAIMIALEEFGDAAGLAGDFLAVFRRQRRRWFMKMTVGSLAVCVCVAVGIVAVLPSESTTPMIARVVAQEAQADAEAFGTPPQGGSGSPQPGFDAPMGGGDALLPGAGVVPGNMPPTAETHNSQTERKLNQRMACAYPMLSLMDVLRDFSEQRDVQLFVNRKAAEEAGVNLQEQMIDLQFKSIRGDMLLDLILNDAGLVYTIRDGIIVVTTDDDLGNTLEVRVYNCSDLMAMMYSASGGQPMGMMPGAGADAAASGMGMSSMGGMPGMPGMPGMEGGMGSGMGMPMMGGMGAGSMGSGGMSSEGMGMPGMGMAGMSSATQFGGGGGGMMPGTPGNPHRVNSMNALIHVITSTVDPDSWQEQGGPGTIEAYYGGLLICNNNPQTHRRVDELLKMMRNAAKQPAGSVVTGER